VALNTDLVRKHPDYVCRVTADEGDVGSSHRSRFQDVETTTPVILTTSHLLTTGVDAPTCKNVVLVRAVGSMPEFKQIIGRGTRLRTDYEKYFFTIIDFRKATELFADPDWDGPPLQDEDFDPDGPDTDEENEEDDEVFDPDEIEDVIVDPEPIVDDSFGDEEGRTKYVVSGIPFSVLAERVQHYDKDGKLVTESLRDYTRRHVTDEFESLDEFVKRWTDSERKQAIVDELIERGVLLEALEDNVSHEMDAFDLICHVAFDQPPLTRRERADNVRKRNVFTEYGETAWAVLDALLDKYADQGIDAIEDVTVLKVYPLADLGTMTELVRSFGGRAQYDAAVQQLETELYRSAS